MNTARASILLISGSIFLIFSKTSPNKSHGMLSRTLKNIPQPPWLVIGGNFYWACFFSSVLFFAFWSFHLYLMLFQNPPLNSSVCLAWRVTGLFWCLPPCLESQGCHSIPSFYLLLLFCLVLSSLFSLLLAQSPASFPEIALNFFFSR